MLDSDNRGGPYPGRVRASARQDAVAALRRIAYLLERSSAPTYRVRAFRQAAAVLERLDDVELGQRLAAGSLTELSGLGPVTATVVSEAASGQVPEYLRRVEWSTAVPLSPEGAALLATLRGDLHVHSDWSDGGSPITEMAEAARALGHSYLALTDHSPRLTVARGLTAARLREQLDVVAALNRAVAPFRVLAGIEVDILDDGSLDQDADLLARLDVVVASVHSKLAMPAEAMTRRMVTAVANPHVDVLGHCTGRLVTGRGRPESAFDADLVFEACRRFGVAVEVNSRPERLDPPMRLLAGAVTAGCLLSIDTDAHAPGQLEWLAYGCDRVARAGADPASIVNTWDLERLLAWAHRP